LKAEWYRGTPSNPREGRGGKTGIKQNTFHFQRGEEGKGGGKAERKRGLPRVTREKKNSNGKGRVHPYAGPELKEKNLLFRGKSQSKNI